MPSLPPYHPSLRKPAMKQVAGFWLPDHEQFLGPVLARDGGYQLNKQERCWDLLQLRGSPFRVGVDIGAHVGLWSINMAKRFQKVVAFEPLRDHQECYRLNVTDANVTLYECALGATVSEMVRMTRRLGSSCKSCVTDQQRGDSVLVKMLTLDSFVLKDVDFIKIDCEGYESFVVQGGERMIRKYKPVIMVEQKTFASPRYGVSDKAAIDLLVLWGAKVQFEINGDFCMAW